MENSVSVSNVIKEVTWNRIPSDRINSVAVKFTFSEEWNDLLCVAQFSQNGKCYNQLLEDNQCKLPVELKEGYCLLSVFGSKEDGTAYRATTIPLEFVIEDSGFCSDAETPNPPTPNLYDQLIARFIEISNGNLDEAVRLAKEYTDSAILKSEGKIPIARTRLNDWEFLNWYWISNAQPIEVNAKWEGGGKNFFLEEAMSNAYALKYVPTNFPTDKTVCVLLSNGIKSQKFTITEKGDYTYEEFSADKQVDVDQTFNPKSKNAQSGTAVEQARTSAVKESAVYTDSIKVNLDDEINFLTGEVSDAKQEIDKAVHTTLNVEIEDDGFGGYRADYNDNDINNHRNAGGLVQAKYYDTAKKQTYTYYYSTMESDRKPTFIRTYINEQGQTEQVLASVGNDKKVTVERRIAKGTTDYTALENKPSINNVELSGNKTNRDLSIPNIYVGETAPVGTDIQINPNGEKILIPDRTSDLINDSGFVTEGKYELIETIITQEAEQIVRTNEPNGTPYNFEKVIAYTTVLVDTDTRGFFKLKNENGEQVADGLQVFGTNRIYGKIIYDSKIPLLLYNREGTKYDFDFTGAYPLFQNQRWEKYSLKNSRNITKIELNIKFPKGSIIEIWGVRA